MGGQGRVQPRRGRARRSGPPARPGRGRRGSLRRRLPHRSGDRATTASTSTSSPSRCCSRPTTPGRRGSGRAGARTRGSSSRPTAASCARTPRSTGRTATLFVATSDDLRTWAQARPGVRRHPVREAHVEERLDRDRGASTAGSSPPAGSTGGTGCTGARASCFAATSDDLVRWEPVELDATGDRYLTYDAGAPRPGASSGCPASGCCGPLLFPRRGRFDSLLVEPGPPAVATDEGIVLVANGANHSRARRPVAAAALAYQPGQVLFDPRRPGVAASPARPNRSCGPRAPTSSTARSTTCASPRASCASRTVGCSTRHGRLPHRSGGRHGLSVPRGLTRGSRSSTLVAGNVLARAMQALAVRGDDMTSTGSTRGRSTRTRSSRSTPRSATSGCGPTATTQYLAADGPARPLPRGPVHAGRRARAEDRPRHGRVHRRRLRRPRHRRPAEGSRASTTSASSRRAATSAAPGTGTATPARSATPPSFVYMPLLEETGHMPTEKYAHAPEILEHCQRIGKQFGLYDNALFHTEVTDLEWDDDALALDHPHQPRRRVHRPVRRHGHRPAARARSCPGIPGIETFEGHSFHTSRWDYDYTGGDPSGAPMDKLADKRVGDHRHRRHRGAVRARTWRAACERALRLPAHAVVGRRARQPADRPRVVRRRSPRRAGSSAGSRTSPPTRPAAWPRRTW